MLNRWSVYAGLGLAFGSAMFASVAAQAKDSGGLFERMAGTWVGEGERVLVVSGKRVRIEARVEAAEEADNRLASHNEITETSESGQVKRYVRDYWVQPSIQGHRHYEFGRNDQVTSQGRFEDGILEVRQELGDWVILSRTQFTSQESIYQETVWN
jgi:hypothetical protein